MHLKENGYSETIQRYCHVINANTTVLRTMEKDGFCYSCKGCDKAKDGGCVSKNCFNPCNQTK